MSKKIGGLARALDILLAIVAGFVALGTMDIAVGSGRARPDRRPRDARGQAGPADRDAHRACRSSARRSTHIPAIGAQLTAVCGNLQMGIAGALATAIAILLYDLTWTA